jgi:hypothetical protein
MTLDITEGVKKALKGCPEGLYCIAVTGLWNWKVKGKDSLIPDFVRIKLDGRKVVVTMNNDWRKQDKHQGGTKKSA